MAEAAPLLSIRGVSKSFGGLKALRAVDLDVPIGRISSLIGPNGAGKSTLFNIVSGLYGSDSGTVHFQGTDITGWPTEAIVSAGITRTFQSIRLFSDLNAIENVMAARFCRTRSNFLTLMFPFAQERAERRETRERAEGCLAMVGLGDRRFDLAADLSFLDQRRLEIARALATEPKLLMLDEPSAGSNPSEAQQLMAIIRQVADLGITVLLIEHNMDVVMNISELVNVLDFGEIIASGLPHEVQADERVLRAYLGTGFGE